MTAYFVVYVQTLFTNVKSSEFLKYLFRVLYLMPSLSLSRFWFYHSH
jgi:hypothetical protein